jgi:hypothetical protein
MTEHFPRHPEFILPESEFRRRLLSTKKSSPLALWQASGLATKLVVIRRRVSERIINAWTIDCW